MSDNMILLHALRDGASRAAQDLFQAAQGEAWTDAIAIRKRATAMSDIAAGYYNAIQILQDRESFQSTSTNTVEQ